jgi:transcriptional regulator
MYIPNNYKNEDANDIKNFIKHHSFGILVTHGDGKTLATHIPLELAINKRGKEVLQGHIAKKNPQKENFKNNTEVLCIFSGPHSYVSSSWYTYEEVPTWNYIAVHVYGKLKVIAGEALVSVLKELVDKHEAASENPIAVEQLSDKTMRQVNGIVGFEIEITDIQATKKLSQGEDAENYSNIISKLENKNEGNANAIATCMKDLKIKNEHKR